MSKRKPHPTQKELQELFFYDEETGLLHWKIRPAKRIKFGAVAGCVNTKGYCQVQVKSIRYQAHNLIWIWNYGDIPDDLEIDHIDKDSSNNAVINLRLSTRRQQCINRNMRGFHGYRKRWQAFHTLGKACYIGTYLTALQARLAYERYTSELEPEFASTFFTDAFNRLIAA